MISLLVVSAALAAPGEHIPVGNALIAPSVGLGVEYSTNPFLEESVGPDSGGANLRLSPAVALRLESEDLDIVARGSYDLRKYVDAADVPLDRYDDFGVVASLDALKKARVGVRLFEAFGLQNFPVDADATTRSYTSQLRNQTEGSVVVRPGSALEVSGGGRYTLDEYRSAAYADLTGDAGYFNTRHTFGPTASVSWKLFPRTAIVFDFSFDRATYATKTLEQGGTIRGFPDHDMLRLEAGIRGRITPRSVVTLTAGYGAARYDEDSVPEADPSIAADLTGLERLLIDVNGRYELGKDQGVTLGIKKDFRDSFFTNYVSYVKAWAGADARFAEKFGALGELSVTAEDFGGYETREDVVLGARADAAFYLREWLAISAGAAWVMRSSTEPSVEYGAVSGQVMVRATY